VNGHCENVKPEVVMDSYLMLIIPLAVGLVGFVFWLVVGKTSKNDDLDDVSKDAGSKVVDRSDS
jgi:hypothetical protein